MATQIQQRVDVRDLAFRLALKDAENQAREATQDSHKAYWTEEAYILDRARAWLGQLQERNTAEIRELYLDALDGMQGFFKTWRNPQLVVLLYKRWMKHQRRVAKASDKNKHALKRRDEEEERERRRRDQSESGRNPDPFGDLVEQEGVPFQLVEPESYGRKDKPTIFFIDID